MISMPYLFLMIFVKLLFAVSYSRTFDLLITDCDVWWCSDLCTVVSDTVQCCNDHVDKMSYVNDCIFV